jgi:hypothetical protein
MALPVTAETTCDIYRLGNAPPAAPDVAAVPCRLQGDYGRGLEAGKTMSASYRFHYILLLDLGTDIRDGYNNGSTNDADTVFVPDKNGVMYRVRFVERVGWNTPFDHKRVYLARDATPWPTSSV